MSDYTELCGLPLRPNARDLVLILACSQSPSIPVFLFLRPFAKRLSWSRRGDSCQRATFTQGETLSKLFELNISGEVSQHTENETIGSSSEVASPVVYEDEAWDLGPELDALRSKRILQVAFQDGFLGLGLSAEARNSAWELFARDHNELVRTKATLVKLILHSLPDPYTEPLWESVCSACIEVIKSTLIPILRSKPRWLQNSMEESAICVIAFHFANFGFDIGDIPWTFLPVSSLSPDAKTCINIMELLSPPRDAVVGLSDPDIKQLNRVQGPMYRALVGLLIFQISLRRSVIDSQNQYSSWRSWWSSDKPFHQSHVEEVACALLYPSNLDIENISITLPASIVSAIGVVFGQHEYLGASSALLKKSLNTWKASSKTHGILCAELIKRLNLLKRAEEAKAIGYRCLKHPIAPGNRQDRIYVKISTADACIATEEYKLATVLLEDILSQPGLDMFTELCTALRLNKVWRRLGTEEVESKFAHNLHRMLRLMKEGDPPTQAEFLSELQATLYHTLQMDGSCSPQLQDTFDETLSFFAIHDGSLKEQLSLLHTLHNTITHSRGIAHSLRDERQTSSVLSHSPSSDPSGTTSRSFDDGNSTSSQRPILEQVAMELQEAISRTATEISKQFLPNPDLFRILSQKNLVGILAELFGISSAKRSEDDNIMKKRLYRKSVEGEHDDSWRTHAETLAAQTIQVPSRLSLLALFLWRLRPGYLALFKEWLVHGIIPDLPFSNEDLKSRFSRDDANYIRDFQGLFLPFTLCEFENQELPLTSRMPILRPYKKIKIGLSGNYDKVKIAAGHWKYRDNHGNEIVTTKDYILAIKVLHYRRDTATYRKAVEDLMATTSVKRGLQLDLGSITEEDKQGQPICSLFFELEICSLIDFFHNEEYAAKYRISSIEMSKAVDILEALAFLHDKIGCSHLVIRSTNIMVFRDLKSEDTDALMWKFASFELSTGNTIQSNYPWLGRLSHSASDDSAILPYGSNGFHRAPELRNYSTRHASQASDVWSMGGILLQLLAFLNYGPMSLKSLETRSIVISGDLRQSLYVTEDMDQWPGKVYRSLEYLYGFSPQISTIPGGAKATLHPEVMRWSEIIYDGAAKAEQYPLREALGIVFMEVLIIDPLNRISASALCRRFSSVRDRYRELELSNEPTMRLSSAPTETTPRSHNLLCSTISRNDGSGVAKIIHEPEMVYMLNEPCRGCGECPIHRAILDKAYNTVQALVQQHSAIDINMKSPRSGRTPIELACEGHGDELILDTLLLWCRDSIRITEEFCNSSKYVLDNGSWNLISNHVQYQKSKDKASSIPQGIEKKGKQPL